MRPDERIKAKVTAEVAHAETEEGPLVIRAVMAVRDFDLRCSHQVFRAPVLFFESRVFQFARVEGTLQPG